MLMHSNFENGNWPSIHTTAMQLFPVRCSHTVTGEVDPYALVIVKIDDEK